MNEMLIWHATGDEKEIYPDLERVAPRVAEAYVMDHRGLNAPTARWIGDDWAGLAGHIPSLLDN